MPVEDHPFFEAWDFANAECKAMREGLEKGTNNAKALNFAEAKLQEIEEMISAYDNDHAKIGSVHILKLGQEDAVFVCSNCKSFEKVNGYYGETKHLSPKKFQYVGLDFGALLVSECHSCNTKTEIRIPGAN